MENLNSVHSNHVQIKSQLPVSPLNSYCGFRMYMEKKDDGNGGGNDDGNGGGDDGNGNGGGDGGGKGGKKGGSAEDRVRGALDKATAAEQRAAAAEKKLQEREQADEQARQKKLQEDGEFQKLAQEAQDKLKALEGDHTSTKAQLQEANDHAQEIVDAQLEAIEDKEKREAVKSQLEGKTPLQQMKAMPNLLKLAGITAGAPAAKPKVGGGGTPEGEQNLDDVQLNKKTDRFKELLAKSQKTAQGGEKLTQAERAELQRLGTELDAEKRKRTEAAKKKEGGDDDQVTRMY